MKNLLRSYLITLISLYFTSQIIQGFKLAGGLKTLFFGALAMTIINWFLKPLVKLLMLPFNILSLGLLSWVVNVLMLYILTRLVPQISLSSWKFTGFSFQGFNIPAVEINLLVSFILASFTLAFIANFLQWFCKK